MKKKFIPNLEQQSFIDFNNGYAIVLAAPGCGKTESLSYRILKAHQEYSVPFSDMLCITFTNRASREMKNRVRDVVGDVMEELFVGNLHRFCINFLYDNGIIPIDTGILDDNDQQELISEILGLKNKPSTKELNGILYYACKLTEDELSIPQGIRPHRYLYSYESAKNLAKKYHYFKKENHLIDFDDILYLTYHAMDNPNYQKDYIHAAYKWIQVDEVQDLNALQLAIIDKLTDPNFQSVVFLGDKGQSIYSFIGARPESITNLSSRTNGNIIHFRNNYRSPLYLIDMLNDYATKIIGEEYDKLPITSNNTHLDDALTTIKCNNNLEQFNVVATIARLIYAKSNDESIGILVRKNDDAEAISHILNEHRIEHIIVSKKDIFKSIEFKTLYAHFSIASQDTRFSDWTRILYQMHAVEKLSDARNFIHEMKALSIIPSDLLLYENSTYCLEFADSYINEEIVVFDTETTGLNIFEDDIIQIAAVKVKNGKVVPNSEIDIIIETDKQIPATLKNGYINPLVKEYENRKHGIRNNSFEYYLSAQDAFAMFVDYVGNDQLLGHNVNYDVHILENNIYRRTKGIHYSLPTYWDTLKLSFLLSPNLHKHNLESLIKIYDLEGVNSHNALDDIRATKSLMSYCYSRIADLLDKQKNFLEEKKTKDIQRRLLKNYYPLYKHTQAKLYSSDICKENTFDSEFKYIYNTMLEEKYIKPIKCFDYMSALFDKVVINKDKDKYFYQQLVNHLYEFRTFNEADLYQNGIINERIHIMTIHKSKGLEFDNVLIFNVSSNVFPPYWSNNIDEDAKVLYVGMSRAKKRLYISYEGVISEFLSNGNINEHFYDMHEDQKQKLLEMEEMLKSI